MQRWEAGRLQSRIEEAHGKTLRSMPEIALNVIEDVFCGVMQGKPAEKQTMLTCYERKELFQK